jgi:stress-induced morphogen
MIDTETSRERQKRMTELLNAAFAPAQLNIEDESHLHVGHPGAASGGGHYQVRIVSSAFAGQSRVRRHQMVYQALGEMIDGDIHALGIIARTPDELATENGRSAV